jgi:hypothetical protein
MGAGQVGAVGRGWLGSDLDPDSWRHPVPVAVGDELVERATALTDWSPAKAPPLSSFSEPLAETVAFALEIRQRLRSDGFVVLSGFPVDEPEVVVERAYMLLGLELGSPVSQSTSRDYTGRVEDRGSDISVPTQRGYKSSAALPFHCDRTDLIGLLCIRPAITGGESRLVSSIAVHNLLGEEDPLLLRELYGLFPNDRRGEEQPGEAPWTPLPVFSLIDSRLSTRYVRRFIEGSQRHPDAPRLTTAQLLAMDAVDAILERPGVSLDMSLQAGDLQLIDNFRILHARTAFSNPEVERARLLLRLWLATPDSPELPPEYSSLYGATTAGTYRGGVWPRDWRPPETGGRIEELRSLKGIPLPAPELSPR